MALSGCLTDPPLIDEALEKAVDDAAAEGAMRRQEAHEAHQHLPGQPLQVPAVRPCVQPFQGLHPL